MQLFSTFYHDIESENHCEESHTPSQQKALKFGPKCLEQKSCRKDVFHWVHFCAKSAEGGRSDRIHALPPPFGSRLMLSIFTYKKDFKSLTSRMCNQLAKLSVCY